MKKNNEKKSGLIIMIVVMSLLCLLSCQKEYGKYAGKVTDYDGNTYKTVKIGDQVWMAENLRTTHYADGTSIALGSSTSTTTAYRYYPNNDQFNVSTYGYLYNWKAVTRDSTGAKIQGICPDGWHVPSYREWKKLIDYVGSRSEYVCDGDTNTNHIAKALAATVGWNSSTNKCAVGNNPSANNATGFSAFPAGFYCGSHNDNYTAFGYYAYFWSGTRFLPGGINYVLDYNSANIDVQFSSDYIYGFSVRCIHD